MLRILRGYSVRWIQRKDLCVKKSLVSCHVDEDLMACYF